jgi:hypothetical protein
MLLIAAAMVSFSQAQAKKLGWSLGYFTTWDNTYTPETIPWESFTHMAYFQVWPNADGTLRLPNEGIAKRVIAEAHKRGKKAIFCVGGAGVKDAFKGATNAANMGKFNSNILAYLKKLGWDGFDTDWEEDFDDAQFIAWHKALRDSINKLEPVPLMTIAAEDWFPITAKVHMYVDQVNNMRYSGTSAAQYSSKLAVFTKAGAAKSKVGAGLGVSMEMTVQQVTDMTKMVLDSGWGGLIQWDVTKKGTTPEKMAAIAPYVPVMATGLYAGPTRYREQVTLSIDMAGGVRKIRYGIPASRAGGRMEIGLYDLQGSLVRTLKRGRAEAGEHSVDLEPANRAHVVRLTAGDAMRATLAR